ncbi:MAG: helix-turn-helix domain-containing protein [Candidatus Dormiibacterota bacterium]
MSQEVNAEGRRRYRSSRRAAGAAETRKVILAAARRLFLERGYVATTMAAIATEAQVALDTVYAAVGVKPVLFRLLVESAISGTDEAVPADERDYVLDLKSESDPQRKVEIYARAIRRIMERLAPLFRLLRDAAAVDPELRALWEEIAERRARNMLGFAQELDDSGGLRDGVSTQEAADVIWAMNSPEFFLLLVHERRWTGDRFQRWLAGTWAQLLLKADGR